MEKQKHIKEFNTKIVLINDEEITMRASPEEKEYIEMQFSINDTAPYLRLCDNENNTKVIINKSKIIFLRFL